MNHRLLVALARHQQGDKVFGVLDLFFMEAGRPGDVIEFFAD